MEVELKKVVESGGSGEGGDIFATQKKGASEKEELLKPKFVDRLYASDRIVKFDNEGRMAFGEVSINMQTNEAKIAWADGLTDILPKIGDGVAVEGIFGVTDRKTVGLGSKVTDGKRLGQVREKRFLVTVVLCENWNAVIKDIPVEDLHQLGFSKKHDKVVFKNQSLGVIVDTKAKIYFKMDKNGQTGVFTDNQYGYVLPSSGEKIPVMGMGKIWETQWSDNASWWWNLKNLGNAATVLRSEVDCFSIAWMGHIDQISDEFPKNVLRSSEDLKEVYQLYGRNWKYIKEFQTYGYFWKDEDALITYDQWVHEISRKMFFGLRDEVIDVPEVENITFPSFESGDLINVKAALWRSVVDVEWDDGTFQTLPSYELCPYWYNENSGSGPCESYYSGDYVVDLIEEPKSSKYGIVMKVLADHVELKWITPDSAAGREPHVSSITEVPFCRIDYHDDYLYLKNFGQLPVLIPRHVDDKGVRQPVDGIRVAIAVGIDIVSSKIFIKPPDGNEKLVWAHDFDHFEGDVVFDFPKESWEPWYVQGGEKKKAVRDAGITFTKNAKYPTLPFVSLQFPEKVCNEDSEEDVF